MKYASFGSISSGTMRDADLLDTFASELEYHVQRNAEEWCSDAGRAERDRLVDLINGAREFTYAWRKDPGKWFVCSADAGSQALVDLGDALLGRVNLDANIKVPFAGITLGKHKTPKAPEIPTLDTFAKRAKS